MVSYNTIYWRVTVENVDDVQTYNLEDFEKAMNMFFTECKTNEIVSFTEALNLTSTNWKLVHVKSPLQMRNCIIDGAVYKATDNLSKVISKANSYGYQVRS